VYLRSPGNYAYIKQGQASAAVLLFSFENDYAYARGSPINYSDRLGLWTFQVGGNFGWSNGQGLTFSVGGGLIVDSNGDAGWYGQVGGGGSSAGTGSWWGGAGGAFSPNAKSICDIGGPFHEVGGGGRRRGSWWNGGCLLGNRSKW